MNKKETTIEQIIVQMEELLIAQDKALKTAESLLDLKSSLINILEKQIDGQAREIKHISYCFYASVAFNVISLIISYVYGS